MIQKSAELEAAASIEMFRIREEGRQEAARDPQTAITRQWILDMEGSGMVYLLEVWVL